MSFGSYFNPGGCCPYKQSNLPQPSSNLIKFVMYGYVYTETPIFFNHRGEMINLQYTADINTLTYTWTFYKPENQMLCNLNIILITSEDVMPTIYDEITGTYMNLTRIERANGRTRWFVSC